MERATLGSHRQQISPTLKGLNLVCRNRIDRKHCRVKVGYLLRDVVNKLNAIHFTSNDEIHTLGHLYESMLKEMRDAAGDSGEFYTPRAVVRFMVEVLHPQLGETVLDPACGTGGFLVEAFAHLSQLAGFLSRAFPLSQSGIDQDEWIKWGRS